MILVAPYIKQEMRRNGAMNTGPALAPDTWEGTPLYGVEAQDGGPQCSASTDFCFLCHFEQSPTQIGTPADLYGSLVETINLMGEQNRELSQIVDKVSDNYENFIRPHVSYRHPETCILIEKPAWVKASIRRHLLYSAQFRSLFHITIEQMYHSILAKQNASMIDASSGQIDGQRLREFNETIKTFMAFQKHITGKQILSGTKSRSRELT